jgi:hypothetical protein
MEEMVMMRQLKVSELIAVDGGWTVSFYDGDCGTIPHYPLPLPRPWPWPIMRQTIGSGLRIIVI